MARGRKPTPGHLSVVRGNPGKRKLPAACPEPESVYLPPPPFLDDVARGEWDRLMPQLIHWGLFSSMDFGALAGYCAMYATFVEMKTRLDVAGATYETDGRFGKMQRTRPEFAIMIEALKQTRAFGAEFGLTPSARMRLKGAAQGELFPDVSVGDTASKKISPWDAL